MCFKKKKRRELLSSLESSVCKFQIERLNCISGCRQQVFFTVSDSKIQLMASHPRYLSKFIPI